MNAPRVIFLALLGLAGAVCQAGPLSYPPSVEEKVKGADVIVIGKATNLVPKKGTRDDRNYGEFSFQLTVTETILGARFVPPAPWRLKITQPRRRTEDARTTLMEGKPLIFLLKRGYDDNKRIWWDAVGSGQFALPLSERTRVEEILKQRVSAERPN